MTKRLRSILFILPILLASGGCYQESLTEADGTGDVEASRLPIFGGSAATSPGADAVVGLQLVKNGRIYRSPFCSGTLITGDVVVTAAHCVTELRGTTRVTKSASSMAVYVGDNPLSDSAFAAHLYMVDEVAAHPAYDGARLLNDIALVRLAQPVDEPVTPVEALPVELGLTEADVGEVDNLVFMGFGQTETGSVGVKLEVAGTLAGFGCTVAGCSSVGDPATQISYTQADGTGPCFGDSGGPAFIYRDGVPYVAGLTSYGDQNCTLYGVSTRTDAFEVFINEFVQGPDCSDNGVCNPDCAAGADPDCAGCGDGVCGSGESCDGRLGTVACTDCPGRPDAKRPSCYVEGVCVGTGCR